MSDPAVPPLTVGDVLAGWDTRWARVMALGSQDGVGCSLTGTNGNYQEVYTEYWTYDGEAWRLDGGVGGSFHPQGVAQWTRDDFGARATYTVDVTGEAASAQAGEVGEMRIEIFSDRPDLDALVTRLRERLLVDSSSTRGLKLNVLLAVLDESLLLSHSGQPQLALETLRDGLFRTRGVVTLWDWQNLLRLGERYGMSRLPTGAYSSSTDSTGARTGWFFN